nr:chaperone protein DnaJ 6-like [Ipomoea batatas]
MNSLFSSLASKYGGDQSTPEPSEEAFEAARQKLESKKKSKRKLRDNDTARVCTFSNGYVVLHVLYGVI